MAKWKGKDVSNKQLFDLKRAAEYREYYRSSKRSALGHDIRFYSNGTLIASGRSIRNVVIEK
ncbi:hypothetical protein HWC53_gp099 [Bacillus phage vB_BmeM-Goe8]|uniref:Uncharacterized protein n=1 Tax=Bacillus phage vB_BmeM-Goe8 TaxID=2593638 RepID=A0A516KN26_9CAUD|nr:hypothetical protein HWC53_gp099 [Bacillus phage vB_BmeM-Goe8]QDP42990.1 hypothetical protein Goe8_c02170 [Bacillus phage vB_BmeM-Goe8]